MEITKEGKEEVYNALANAKKGLGKAQAAIIDQLGIVTRLAAQADCKHEEVVHQHGFMYDFITCQDCGYIWQEI